LLLFGAAILSAQNEGSKSRFDKILQDFGFSGSLANQKQSAPPIPEDRKQPIRASTNQNNRSTGRSRDIDIQSNSIPDTRPKSRPSKKVKSSDALAALFSVAGRPKETKKPLSSVQIKNNRPSASPKLPVSKVLNERIENPVFSSKTPSRKVSNNKGLIESERINRNKSSRRNQGSRARSKPQDATKFDFRKPIPVAQTKRPKFTSQGIPVVAKISIKAQPNQSKTPKINPNTQQSARLRSSQSVPANSSPVSSNKIRDKNAKPIVDPVARLASIASNKGSNQRIVTQSASSGVGQPIAKRKNLAGNIAAKQQSVSNVVQKKSFSFDDTLKEFGFSPRLVSETNFKPTPAALRTQISNERKVLPVPQNNVKPFIQQKGIPTISNKPNPTSGLNSLIALAGDPNKNPVIKTSAPPISPIKPIPRRTDALRQGQTPNTRVPPNNSALGNLQSIADGKGPTITVRNRARGPSRKPVNSLPSRKNPPRNNPSPSTSLPTPEKSLFEINPFVNVNLQKKQEEAPRSQSAKVQKNISDVQRPQSFTNNEVNDARINIPRQKPSNNQSRPKIIIDEDEFDDSFEEEIGERRTKPRKTENKDDKRQKSKKKRPSKGKKQELIEQRPPVIGGCFHVCKTLIFEVYQLLGGSLCDCVK